jgi:hypothetical protein
MMLKQSRDCAAGPPGKQETRNQQENRGNNVGKQGYCPGSQFGKQRVHNGTLWEQKTALSLTLMIGVVSAK